MATKQAKFPKLSANNDMRRNLLLFKGYLNGRIRVLTDQGKEHPAEKGECDRAISELNFIYDNILTELFKYAS